MEKMQDKETQQKTIRMEKELIEKIEKMAEGTERDFTIQVKYMLRKYIEIVESTKS